MFAETFLKSIAWLQDHHIWLIVIVFLIAFAESLAIVGLFIPGSIVMTSVGVLVGTAHMTPLWVGIAAITGAFSGDFASFLFGLIFSEDLEKSWIRRKFPQMLTQGQYFITHHGGKSLFLGRFLGPLRAIVPLVAGMLNMDLFLYLIISIPSAILWAVLYMAPGYFMAQASSQLPPHFAHTFIWFLIVLICLIWMVWKIILSLNRYILTRSTTYFLAKAKNLKVNTRFCPNPYRKARALTFLINGVALGLLLAGLLILIQIKWSGIEWINYLFIEYTSFFHGKILIHIASFITLLGERNFFIYSSILISLYLLFAGKRLRSFLTYFFFQMVYLGFLEIIKFSFYHPRPIIIFANKSLSGLSARISTNSSFPSGHTVLSFASFFIFAFLLSHSSSRRTRKLLYSIAAGLTGAVALSRLILQAHWIIDIFGSFLLSGSLFFLLLSWEQVNRIEGLDLRRGLFVGLSAFFFTILILFLTGYGESALKVNYKTAKIIKKNQSNQL